MIDLRNPILATLAYYDIFDYPLTLPEVYRYLINPGRIMKVSTGLGDITTQDLKKELDELATSGIVGMKNGFYFLNGRDNIYSLRVKRKDVADKKWKKFSRVVRYLSIAPYLEGVFVSGSMALSNTDEKSDFDVLVIIRSGRLYTCRLFLWLISSIFGIRRKKHERVAPDKLCFNHYITDGNLYISHESLFNAQTYINLKPVMISQELVGKFYSANLWLNNYVYNFRPQNNLEETKLSKIKMFKIISRILELILDSSFGDRVEKMLKKIQQDKIRKNPVTYEKGGRIVFNDEELEFHPHSFERTVLARYKEGLRRLGITPLIDEKDSGLN